MKTPPHDGGGGGVGIKTSKRDSSRSSLPPQPEPSKEDLENAERRAIEVLIAVTKNLLNYRADPARPRRPPRDLGPLPASVLFDMSAQAFALRDDPGERARRAAIRAMGKMLYDLGGRDAMDRGIDQVWTELGGVGVSPIDSAWSGVGGPGVWVS